MLKLVKTVKRLRNGGSCSVCNDDYIGTGTKSDKKKGYQVMATPTKERIVEPYNVCEQCHNKIQQQRYLETSEKGR